MSSSILFKDKAVVGISTSRGREWKAIPRLCPPPPELAKTESVRKNTETETKVLGYKPGEVCCFIVCLIAQTLTKLRWCYNDEPFLFRERPWLYMVCLLWIRSNLLARLPTAHDPKRIISHLQVSIPVICFGPDHGFSLIRLTVLVLCWNMQMIKAHT